MIDTAKKKLHDKDEQIIQKGHIEIIEMPGDDDVVAESFKWTWNYIQK